VQRLRSHGHPVVAIGRRNTKVADVKYYQRQRTPSLKLYGHTLPQSITPAGIYMIYISFFKPQTHHLQSRTENDDLARMAKEKNIGTIEACTLVLLSTGQY
jgi:hypothetical protein